MRKPVIEEVSLIESNSNTYQHRSYKTCRVVYIILSYNYYEGE